MTGIELTAGEWLSLLTHIKKWLSNLQRAKQPRKVASKAALQDVIKAARKSMIYDRHIREGGDKSLQKETDLVILWTDLSFKLNDLGLLKLAKRCHIKGVYEADPTSLDKDFVEKAGVRLADIERLAKLSLQELNN